MVMTYNSLVTQIQTYAYRNDDQFVKAIPYFIENAHYHIYRDAKDLGEQSVGTGQFFAKNPVVPKPLAPTAWNQTISFSYGIIGDVNTNITFLLPRTYEFCRAYWPNSSTSVAPPLFYADNAVTIKSGNADVYPSFYIAPTPDQAYRYQLVYLTQPVIITGNPSTNWLTQYAPDLLFYACMIEAIPFLKDDERVPVWQAMYKEALQSVNNYTRERYSDRIYKRDKD